MKLTNRQAVAEMEAVLAPRRLVEDFRVAEKRLSDGTIMTWDDYSGFRRWTQGPRLINGHLPCPEPYLGQ